MHSTRRKFLRTAMAAPIAVYVGFPGGIARATSSTYSVNVTTTAQTGYQQDHNGNWLPHYWSGLSGNKIRLQSHTKAIQLANDIQAKFNNRQAIAQGNGFTLPDLHVVVVSHSGPNSDPTAKSDLEQIGFMQMSPVLPVLDANRNPTGQYAAPKDITMTDGVVIGLGLVIMEAGVATGTVPAILIGAVIVSGYILWRYWDTYPVVFNTFQNEWDMSSFNSQVTVGLDGTSSFVGSTTIPYVANPGGLMFCPDPTNGSGNSNGMLTDYF